MAEVRIAMFAPYLDALHEKASVFLLNDVARLKRPCKARPSGPRIELIRRTEEGLTGDDIHVDPFLMVIPVLILEGSLRSVLLGHFVLEGSQFLFQGCIIRFLIRSFLLWVSRSPFPSPMSSPKTGHGQIRIGKIYI